jgi:hypothetical protein
MKSQRPFRNPEQEMNEKATTCQQSSALADVMNISVLP